MPHLLPLALAGALLLSGCAAQMNYREARGLLAANQPDAALPKLQAATEAEPDNAVYRNAWNVTRKKLVENHLDRARRALSARDRAEAERQFRRALEVDADSASAREGLARLADMARHEQLFRQAEAQFEARQWDAARRSLRTLLQAEPGHSPALALDQALTERLATLEASTQAARALRKPLGIELRDASLKQAFEVVGRAAELNILLDKDVKADNRVSLMLKDSSVEAALNYLLMTQQLEQQRLDANTLLVYPNTAAKLRDYQQLVLRTFVLANANAKAVAEMIKTIVKSRDVVIDEKLNMVILRDSPEAVRLAERLVALQDVAEPEVVLDVEILEVTRDRLMELGVSWPGGMSLAPLSGSTGSALTVGDLRRLSAETIGVTVDPLKINARAVDGDTNLLANPRIRVLNREKARVVIGNKVPTITTSVIATGIVSESANYLDVGLKLEVEPFVYVNNDVAIRMSLEVSNIVGTQTTKQGTVTYTIGTRSASTMLRLKDGENQVLAGLINDEDRRSANKVPLLGELPLAGRLFGNTLNDGKKTEIVLSITPRLVRNISRPAGDAAEFATGTEASLRSRLNTVSTAPVGGPPALAAPAANPASAPVPAAAPAAKP